LLVGVLPGPFGGAAHPPDEGARRSRCRCSRVRSSARTQSRTQGSLALRRDGGGPRSPSLDPTSAHQNATRRSAVGNPARRRPGRRRPAGASFGNRRQTRGSSPAARTRTAPRSSTWRARAPRSWRGAPGVAREGSPRTISPSTWVPARSPAGRGERSFTDVPARAAVSTSRADEQLHLGTDGGHPSSVGRTVALTYVLCKEGFPVSPWGR
jgi:hypothetical protein